MKNIRTSASQKRGTAPAWSNAKGKQKDFFLGALIDLLFIPHLRKSAAGRRAFPRDVASRGRGDGGKPEKKEKPHDPTTQRQTAGITNKTQRSLCNISSQQS